MYLLAGRYSEVCRTPLLPYGRLLKKFTNLEALVPGVNDQTISNT